VLYNKRPPITPSGTQSKESHFFICNREITQNTTNDNTSTKDNPEDPSLRAEFDKFEEEDTTDESTTDGSDEENGIVEKSKTEEHEEETQKSETTNERVFVLSQEFNEFRHSEIRATITRVSRDFNAGADLVEGESGSISPISGFVTE